MPDNSRDTRPVDPIAPMPPGFENLPDEDKLFLYSNRGNPEMLAIYNATKTVQLHRKFDTQREKCEVRICSLEESRKKVKWWGGGALAVLLTLKAYIIGKLIKVLP